jgi:hypothetical protein
MSNRILDWPVTLRPVLGYFILSLIITITIIIFVYVTELQDVILSQKTEIELLSESVVELKEALQEQKNIPSNTIAPELANSSTERTKFYIKVSLGLLAAAGFTYLFASYYPLSPMTKPFRKLAYAFGISTFSTVDTVQKQVDGISYKFEVLNGGRDVRFSLQPPGLDHYLDGFDVIRFWLDTFM